MRSGASTATIVTVPAAAASCTAVDRGVDGGHAAALGRQPGEVAAGGPLHAVGVQPQGRGQRLGGAQRLDARADDEQHLAGAGGQLRRRRAAAGRARGSARRRCRARRRRRRRSRRAGSRGTPSSHEPVGDVAGRGRARRPAGATGASATRRRRPPARAAGSTSSSGISGLAISGATGSRVTVASERLGGPARRSGAQTSSAARATASACGAGRLVGGAAGGRRRRSGGPRTPSGRDGAGGTGGRPRPARTGQRRQQRQRRHDRRRVEATSSARGRWRCGPGCGASSSTTAPRRPPRRRLLDDLGSTDGPRRRRPRPRRPRPRRRRLLGGDGVLGDGLGVGLDLDGDLVARTRPRRLGDGSAAVAALGRDASRRTATRRPARRRPATSAKATSAQIGVAVGGRGRGGLAPQRRRHRRRDPTSRRPATGPTPGRASTSAWRRTPNGSTGRASGSQRGSRTRAPRTSGAGGRHLVDGTSNAGVSKLSTTAARARRLDGSTSTASRRRLVALEHRGLDDRGRPADAGGLDSGRLDGGDLGHDSGAATSADDGVGDRRRSGDVGGGSRRRGTGDGVLGSTSSSRTTCGDGAAGSASGAVSAVCGEAPASTLRRMPGERLVGVPLGQGGAQHLGDRLLAGGARRRRDLGLGRPGGHLHRLASCSMEGGAMT